MKITKLKCICGCGEIPKSKRNVLSHSCHHKANKLFTKEQIQNFRLKRNKWVDYQLKISRRTTSESNYNKTHRYGKRISIKTTAKEIQTAHKNLIRFINPYFCWCCKEKPWTVKAHIKPVCDGGNNHPKNLILLCERCHHFQHLWSLSDPTWNIRKQYLWFKWIWDRPKEILPPFNFF